MSDKIKRMLAGLAALAALALGGAAIAGATSGGDDQGTVQSEQSDQAEGAEEGATDDKGGDGDVELPAVVGQKARAAAEQATGGTAGGDVEPAEPADPVEDANDQPTPKGAAYEVEVSKDGQALKVFLDSSFDVIETQQNAG